MTQNRSEPQARPRRSENPLVTRELPELDVWPSVPPRYCPACQLPMLLWLDGRTCWFCERVIVRKE